MNETYSLRNATGGGKMIRLIIGAFLCFASLLGSGCATLVPEDYLVLRAPDSAHDNMDAARAYADRAASGLVNIQVQASRTEAALNLSSFGFAALAAGHVLYGHSGSALKIPAAALGIIGGIDYTVNPESKRSAVDNGLFALSCAKRNADAMVGTPDAIKDEDSLGSSRSPIASLVGARRSRNIPSPLVPGGGSGAANALHGYANSLRGMGQILAPSLPGTSASMTVLPSLAATVDDAAADHQKGLNDVATKAKSLQLSAPAYLSSTTELILGLVVKQLHQIDPAGKTIASEVQSRTNGYYSDFKTSVDAAQEKATTAQATLKAVAKVAGDVSQTSVSSQTQALSQQGAAVESPPPDGFAPSPLQPKRGRSGRSSISPEAAVKTLDQTNQAAKSSATAAESAVSAVQADQSALDFVKQLTELAAACAQSGT